MRILVICLILFTGLSFASYEDDIQVSSKSCGVTGIKAILILDVYFMYHPSATDLEDVFSNCYQWCMADKNIKKTLTDQFADIHDNSTYQISDTYRDNAKRRAVIATRDYFKAHPDEDSLSHAFEELTQWAQGHPF